MSGEQNRVTQFSTNKTWS